MAADAEVWAKDENGREPLHWAAKNIATGAATAAAHALLEAGVCTSACDKAGAPPWLLVLERADVAACGELLQLLAPGEHTAAADGAGSSSDGSTEQLLKATAAAVRQLLKRKQPAEAEAAGGECVVCLDAPRTVALLPCGHLALCAGCAKKEEARRRCPVCRKKCGKPRGKAVTIYHP